jgi:hypothetical protein
MHNDENIWIIRKKYQNKKIIFFFFFLKYPRKAMSQNLPASPAAQKLNAIIEEMRKYAEIAKEAEAAANKSMQDAEYDEEMTVFHSNYAPKLISKAANVVLITGYVHKINKALEVAKENTKLAKSSACAATRAANAVKHTFGYSLSVAERSHYFWDFEAALKTVEGVMHIAISETSKATKASEYAFGYAASVKEAEASASNAANDAAYSLDK